MPGNNPELHRTKEIYRLLFERKAVFFCAEIYMRGEKTNEKSIFKPASAPQERTRYEVMYKCALRDFCAAENLKVARKISALLASGSLQK